MQAHVHLVAEPSVAEICASPCTGRRRAAATARYVELVCARPRAEPSRAEAAGDLRLAVGDDHALGETGGRDDKPVEHHRELVERRRAGQALEARGHVGELRRALRVEGDVDDPLVAGAAPLGCFRPELAPLIRCPRSRPGRGCTSRGSSRHVGVARDDGLLRVTVDAALCRFWPGPVQIQGVERPGASTFRGVDDVVDSGARRASRSAGVRGRSPFVAPTPTRRRCGGGRARWPGRRRSAGRRPPRRRVGPSRRLVAVPAGVPGPASSVCVRRGPVGDADGVVTVAPPGLRLPAWSTAGTPACAVPSPCRAVARRACQGAETTMVVLPWRRDLAPRRHPSRPRAGGSTPIAWIDRAVGAAAVRGDPSWG